MALGPRLDLRQSQSLVMTPQLQQAIRLLALSNLEVESFIAEELEKNPLLDSAGEDEPNGQAGEAEVALVEAEEPETIDLLVQSGDAERDAPLDVDYNSEDFHQDSAADSMRGLDGDRKCVVWGKSVSVRVALGGPRMLNKKQSRTTQDANESR